MTFRRIGPIMVVALVAISVLAMGVSDSKITWLTGPWSVNQGATVEFKVVLKSDPAGNEMGNCPVEFWIDGGVGKVGTVTTGLAGSGKEGIASLSYNTGTLPLPGGTYTVTAKFAGIDAGIYGIFNASSADQSPLVIIANTPPDAVCQDITAYLDGLGSVTIAPSDVDGGSTDDKGITTMTVSPNIFDCGDTGPNTVTLTVGDAEGETDSCTATVTVKAPVTVHVESPNGGMKDVSVYIRTPGSGSWNIVSGAKTDAAGEYFVGLDCGTYDFHVVYHGTCATKTETVSGLTEVDFDAVITTAEVVDSHGADLAGVSVYYRTSYGGGTGWFQFSPFPTGPSGEAEVETLPYTLTVHAVYHETTETKTASAGDTVEFETHKTTVEVLGCNGLGIDGANVYYKTGYVGHTSWNHIGKTGDGSWSSGEVEIEFLWGSPDKADFHTPDLPAGLSSSSVRSNIALKSTPVVTFDDDIDPTITCPGDLLDVPTDAGECYATGVDLGTPTTADNCAVDTVTNDAPAQFPKGDTTVTWTVTDTSGNTATCEQIVTVQDHEDPTITCPADITQDNDLGVCQAAVTVPAPATGDNCGVAGVVNDYNGTADASDVYPVGTTTVTWTVTDTSGNTNTCTMAVTIVDAEPPTTVFTTTPPDPDNDPTPFFAWAGTDNNGCTAPGNLEFSTNLDAGGWSGWSPATSATIGPLSEGWHTFAVRGRDEAGNVESTASYTWFVDLTLPVINLIMPDDGAEYVLNSDVLANWTARDDASGLAFTTATDASGDAIDTASVGGKDFFVEATDLAGNVARVDITYRVVYGLTAAAGPAGGGGAFEPVEGYEGALCFLDKCIAGGGGDVGGQPLAAIYELGEIILVTFVVTDDDGNLIVDAVSTLTFVEITFIGEDEEYSIVGYFVIPYDGELGLYTLGIPTVTEDWSLRVGYYDLWLDLDDGTSILHRIQIIEPVE